MPNTIDINIIANGIDGIYLSSSFFNSNKFVGSTWDNGQTIFNFNVPGDYTQYSLTLKLENKQFKGSVVLGNNYQYTLVRPITSDEELNIDCMFYDGDVLIASTGTQTVYFRKRIVDTDFTTEEFNAVPYLVGADVNKQYVDDSITNLKQYTDDEISKAIIQPVDLTNYYNKQEVDALIASIPTVQTPFRQDYSGSNTFILPKTPNQIINVYVLNSTDSMSMLRDEDYTLNGNMLMVFSPVMDWGMRIKIEYTATN